MTVGSHIKRRFMEGIDRGPLEKSHKTPLHGGERREQGGHIKRRFMEEKAGTGSSYKTPLHGGERRENRGVI